MPKMPEVTVHVTTEPDPQEAREYKASADMWAEQCRTLQRTLLDTQLERDKLRETSSEFGAALIVARARVAELEARGVAPNRTVRTFRRFLEDRGFQADACEALEHPDFYRLAESMYQALEIIADPTTCGMTHSETVGVLRCHARRAVRP